MDAVKNGKRVSFGNNGCHNRAQYAEGYWAKNGHLIEKHDGQTYAVQKMTWVPHRMSTMCRYDQRQHDIQCQGCNVLWDIEYLKEQGLL